MTPTTEPPRELWTAREAAAFLRVSRRWVYAAAARGELQVYRIRRLVRFNADDVRRLAEEGRA